MKYRIFILITQVKNDPVPQENSLDALNKLAIGDWRVVATLFNVSNRTHLLLEKKK